MTTITKERIELFIKNPLENGLTRGEQMELARIALASLEAEPVAYIIQDSDARSRGEKGILRYFANISDEDINEYEITVTPLYAAPPETVSVPDAMEMDDDFDSAFEHGKAVGWNAYRAAMFQSGNFRENKNSSTNNFREIAETSTNSPAIPEGWIKCSERMPKEYDFDIWIYSPTEGVCHGLSYTGGGEFNDDEFQSTVNDATHWMAMAIPEAPQQEVNRG
ncbi:DUF551 domain-containing protein [Salmonella enterica]|uniref:DUF551 domain-containing protein n=1 Tax=Salmonella enterica TaxID=28901 RepID=UPI000F9F38F2|nr:DUF551 domain-containing protein [Salmonella enterica]EAA4008658.1 DUF551 domain-containing protein [Salmonella enterica subsp. enterica serovar Give]MCL9454897.1 DUF551 domain-containing protein [Salmonella enterica subsp. enterica serovar Enteritidis]EAA7798075.1 DUF551 domain-containing protein [Salmonella enterica]EAB9378319.1 DUF551 domain-containing protein [Salmonella enterica subsp. enterica serovar Give]EAC0498183.1 DUF551 domain-containing protein [Salmonella enterica subsp. enter